MGLNYIYYGYEDIPKELIEYERKYYEERYSISKYEKEIPMCIVMASYNNVEFDRYKFNLISVHRQQYSNYKIVYIDDASTDDTAVKVRDFVR